MKTWHKFFHVQTKCVILWSIVEINIHKDMFLSLTVMLFKLLYTILWGKALLHTHY